MPWGPSDHKTMDTAIGVILRTPGLFIIDYWWQYERNKFVPTPDQKDFLTTFIANVALVNGFLLLLLPISCIRSLYTHFVCGALLLSAHLLSYYYVNLTDSYSVGELTVTGPEMMVANVASSVANTAVAKQISLLAVHVFIAVLVSCLLQGPQKPLLPVLACYALPVIARLADFPAESLQVLHNFSCALVGLSLLRYAYYCLPNLFTSLKGAYSNLLSATEVQGVAALFVSGCTKLFVPTHFLLFWTIAFIMKFYEFSETEATKEWYVCVLSAASAVCSSPVSLLATAVAVTYMSFFVLSAIKLYLGSISSVPAAANRAPHPVQQAHSGWEEGVTTLLLALLTGITDMKQPARMAVLTIILFVVLSSLLQSMLEIAEPVILSLSAYHGRNVFHHLKVLLLCAFLFLFPLHVTWVLAQVFPVDFWMAVVLSTSVLTSAQVLDLVVVHCLLWYDATRDEPWAPLDEVVYYVRGVTKIVEFFVATSVVVVGIYEGATGQWSWTNAFILVVHCYFNVWQRFQAGYRSFVKRRQAVQKSAKLPSATKAQLRVHNDVCAICFMDMFAESNSVVTPCNHFFHRVCLRRWLCFQDRCPLCAAAVNVAPAETIPLMTETADENLNRATPPVANGVLPAPPPLAT